MTSDEVAWVLGLDDVRTVRRMIGRNELPARKIGSSYRISKRAVLDFID